MEFFLVKMGQLKTPLDARLNLLEEKTLYSPQRSGRDLERYRDLFKKESRLPERLLISAYSGLEAGPSGEGKSSWLGSPIWKV